MAALPTVLISALVGALVTLLFRVLVAWFLKQKADLLFMPNHNSLIRSMQASTVKVSGTFHNGGDATMYGVVLHSTLLGTDSQTSVNSAHVIGVLEPGDTFELPATGAVSASEAQNYTLKFSYLTPPMRFSKRHYIGFDLDELAQPKLTQGRKLTRKEKKAVKAK